MQRDRKTEVISALKKNLSESDFIVSTTYQGVSAQKLAQIRWTLAAAGVEYHVVKNTLLRIAAEQAGRERVMDILEGPMALGFANDPVETAKTLRLQTRSRGTRVQIRGALLGDRVFTAAEVIALADLPPRDVLVAQLAAQLQAPVSRLHRALSWPLQGFHNVLQARIESLAQ